MLYVVFMSFLMIQVIFQMSELESLLFFVKVYALIFCLHVWTIIKIEEQYEHISNVMKVIYKLDN